MKVSGEHDRISCWILSNQNLRRTALFLSAERLWIKNSAYGSFCGASKAAKVLMLNAAGTVKCTMFWSVLSTGEWGVSEQYDYFQNYWLFWVCVTSLRRPESLSILLTVNTPHFLTIKGVEVNAGQTASFHCTVNGRKRDSFRLWLQVRPISFWLPSETISECRDEAPGC